MEKMQGLLFTLTMLTGALWDVWKGRIPNWLIAFGLFVGGVFHIGLGGEASDFLLGATTPVVLLFPLFYLHMIGAGDIKLLSVAGGFLGLRAGLSCLLGSFILGAVFSLCKCIVHKNLWVRLQYLAAYFSNYLTTGVRVPYYKKEDGRDMIIPFGVPVFCWAVLYMGGWL